MGSLGGLHDPLLGYRFSSHFGRLDGAYNVIFDPVLGSIFGVGGKAHQAGGKCRR
jgi:hypothetical protein